MGREIIIKSCKFFLPILLFHIFLINETKAQSDTNSIYDLTLSQLTQLKVTSVNKVEQSLNEIPATVFVITAEELKERGIFTLEEALSDLPGFQFRNIQGINSYVFQRGIPNQNNLTLLLIDGIQINELNSGGFYGGGQYNISNIERIEVIHGPASAVYGTNAVSGVINIITKNPLSNSADISAAYGSFNSLMGNFNYSFVNPSESFKIRFSGMYKYSTKAEMGGAEGDYNWTENIENYERDYSFDLKLISGGLTFGTNYIQKQTPTTTSNKAVGTIYSDSGTFWNIRFINNYLKYNFYSSNDFSLTAVLYNRNATVLSNSIYEVVDTAQVGYFRPNNLTGIESIADLKVLENLFITSGLTFEYESLAESNSFSYSSSPNIKPPKPVTPKMISNYLTSIFIEPRIEIEDKLFFSAGLRFDNSTIYDNILTPRAGLSYNYNNVQFRISYSEAFRAPKPWDYTDGVGNNSLNPERMKSIEGAVKTFFHENFIAGINLYRNHLENALTRELTPNGFRWINSGGAYVNGAEFYFNYLIGKLKTNFNYTFTESYNENGTYLAEISRHTFNTGLTYSLSKNFKINFRANYFGKRENPRIIASTNNSLIDPALIFHAAVSLLNYKGIDLQLSVKNIFDTEYYHTSNRQPDRYRQSQRTFIFTAGYSLFN
ncbi:MAG: TonB-dependent receptor [Melioribacteraceae bacterium]|nr:TonB-dependent receptor [Melioribacteraceae bacterium]